MFDYMAEPGTMTTAAKRDWMERQLIRKANIFDAKAEEADDRGDFEYADECSADAARCRDEAAAYGTEA